MRAEKKTKKQIIQTLTDYGLHIWAILIIANAVMVYAYHFASHASIKTNEAPRFLDASQAPPSLTQQLSPSAAPSTQISSRTPLGPILNLSFSVPGIGSGGGVMKPLHPTRNVTVFLYAQDANSLNPNVQPLYTIQGAATFDSDPTSPTYTSFVNPVFDLGSDVQDGVYQIAFRTDQSLRTLIKQNPTDLGGEIISVSKNGQPLQLFLQSVLMGDIVPLEGDNNIDINDYNTFINCYGDRNASSFCQGKSYGDFNDDGKVDGIDYNILLRTLTVLKQEGIAIPVISPTPAKRVKQVTNATPNAVKKKQPSPTRIAVKKGNNAALLASALLPVLSFGVLIFGVILYFKNERIHNAVHALIHLSPTESQDAELGSIEGNEPMQQAEQENQETETLSNQPLATDATSQNNVSEKDCYVKIKGRDENGTGLWVMLTDDNGSVEAHYEKTDATDGFAKVKGVMKSENNKTFLEISEITSEA